MDTKPARNVYATFTSFMRCFNVTNNLFGKLRTPRLLADKHTSRMTKFSSTVFWTLDMLPGFTACKPCNVIHMNSKVH